MENPDNSEKNRVSKIGFEIFILLFMVGYILIIEKNIFDYPGSITPLIAGIAIALLYTGLVLFSPKKIRLARLWAVLSIAAVLYWGYLLIEILKNKA